MEIEVVKNDITELDVEAIVNPANSKLRMGGGLAGIIKKKGGSEIEKDARKSAPIKVGNATISTGGDLPADHVIHAPTMKTPTKNVPPKNAGKAMEGILDCADRKDIEKVAVPGLGTGVGGISSEDAAEEMISAAEKFEGENPKKIILVGYGKELHEAFLDKKNSL